MGWEPEKSSSRHGFGFLGYHKYKISHVGKDSVHSENKRWTRNGCTSKTSKKTYSHIANPVIWVTSFSKQSLVWIGKMQYALDLVFL